MSKLTSEVLFNRALLWLLIGWEESRGGENKLMAFSFFLLAAYNVWKSYKAWGWDI